MKDADRIAVRPEQLSALEKFHQAVAKRKQTKLEYDMALKEAVKARISNVRLASVAGVSETAIRMYRKRNGL